jgi:hypothetical protein
VARWLNEIRMPELEPRFVSKGCGKNAATFALALRGVDGNSGASVRNDGPIDLCWQVVLRTLDDTRGKKYQER